MGAKLVIGIIGDRDIENLGRTRRSIATLDGLRVKEIEDLQVPPRPHGAKHDPKHQHAWEQYGFEQQDKFAEFSIFELENHIFSQPKIYPSKWPESSRTDRRYPWSVRSQREET